MSKFTIYSQKGFACPWCEKAVTLLDGKGLAYELRPLDRTSLIEKAAESGMNTVPIIYFNAVLVGGYSELDEYLRRKEAA